LTAADGTAGFGSAGVTVAVFIRADLALAVLAWAGLTSVGLAAAAFGLAFLAAGFASVCGLACKMPGDSCAGAGAAPSNSASIARNGPQRIV
jgi:hypothetical protein